MSSDIENIFQSFMADPNFMIGVPEREKKEKAWKLAWERHRQTERNNAALSMAKEDLSKESVGTMGPDAGPSKYPAKIGGPTTIANTKKFGQETIDLHRDPNRTWRTRPETASEMATGKNLEKINPLRAAKKFFSKPKTLEEKETEKMRRDLGYSKMEKEDVLDSKWSHFKTFLQKHLIDTLEEEPFGAEEQTSSIDADAEIMTETAITIDTIIDALTELRDNISQHELDEMTGQEEDGLELFRSLAKHDMLSEHKHSGSSVINIVPKVFPRTESSVKKHENFSSKPHEHLPWGQVKVPKPKGASWESGKIGKDPMTKKPGSWQGYVEKKDFQDLDFKDQDAVMAEREMLAGKKPVSKPFIPVGGRKNIVSTQKGKPGIFNEQIAASENKPLKKHEDYAMHSHAGKSEKYPFVSHLLPPVKVKTEPVKKDTSSISEITEVQKIRDSRPKDIEKVKNVFAVATEAAKRAGYSDFSEGSPGKEKRGEIAEALKRQKGIKKEAQQTLYNVLSNRKYAAPETEFTAMPPTEFVREQKRVEGGV